MGYYISGFCLETAGGAALLVGQIMLMVVSHLFMKFSNNTQMHKPIRKVLQEAELRCIPTRADDRYYAGRNV